MRRHMINLLVALLLLGMTGISVSAHDVPDLDRSGSITVYVEDDGKKLSSGSLTFYRVGEIADTDGDYYYRPVGAFVAWGETLTDVGTPEVAKSLLDYAQKGNLSGNTVKINDGTAHYTVDKGQLGLYLVAQHEAVTGYRPVDPFLIAVPNWENGAYVYEVNATPKMGNITATAPTDPPAEIPKDPVLPQTGQHKLPVPVLAALGLLMVGGGLLARIGTKNKENEA